MTFAVTVAAADPAGPLDGFLRDPGAVTAALLHHAAHALAATAGRIGPFAVVLLAVAAVAWMLLRRQRRRALTVGARAIGVLAPPDVDPAGALTLWANLTALLRPAWRRLLSGQPHLAFELAWTGPALRICLWVPAVIPPGLVERAVEAAWPGARTTTGPATAPLPATVAATGGQLRLAAPDVFPLRDDHDVDPLRALLGAGSGLDDHESACVQVLARPVTGRRLATARRAAAHLRAGRPASRAGRPLDLLTPGPTSRPASTDPQRAGDVRAILAKAAQPQWAVVIRYAAATTDTGPGTLALLRGRAHALASAFAVYAGRNHFARHRLHRPAATLGRRWFGRGDLLSVPELAAIAHLPTDPAVPGLTRAGAKGVAPPPQVPRDGKPLGVADSGTGRPVALAVTDARHHLHVLGATGAGKSTLLANLILADAAAGRGAVVIDPKGDLVTDLLDRLPAATAGRLVVVDPDERDAPPTLNVLAGGDPDLVVDNLVGIFRRIFEAFWGPRTDDVLRSACLTLCRRPGATLADVPRLLADPGFRRPYLVGLDDDQGGLGGFWSWYDDLGDAARAQVIGPLMNKLRAFLLRDFARQLLGVPDSTIDMSRILDGGLCLVRVPKGILGEETARLVGSFVVAQVWQAATARARAGQAARVDATLYVDECQNFLTLPRSFEEMLAEARGYRLSLVLAHQHLAQLPRALREAISANARSKVYFATSPEDAAGLERHVTPQLSAHDLAHLGAHHAAARLVVDGAETAAFTLRTTPLPNPTAGRAEQLRAAARAQFGRTDAQRRQTQAARALAGRCLPGTEHPADVARGVGSGVASSVGSGVALRSDAPAGSNSAGQRAVTPSPGSPDFRGGWSSFR